MKSSANTSCQWTGCQLSWVSLEEISLSSQTEYNWSQIASALTSETLSCMCQHLTLDQCSSLHCHRLSIQSRQLLPRALCRWKHCGPVCNLSWDSRSDWILKRSHCSRWMILESQWLRKSLCWPSRDLPSCYCSSDFTTSLAHVLSV